ncbi:MAG: OmpA family protein [Bacteroidetes bacterium]|nr:OmpA family protein [Bacteroidota bacterium]
MNIFQHNLPSITCSKRFTKNTNKLAGIFLLVSAVCFSSKTFSQTKTHDTITKTVVLNLGSDVNSAAGELAPTITADGKRLYFVRDGHERNFSGQDVWYSERSNGVWGPAVHPSEPLNHYGKNSHVSNVSTDGNQLLVSGAFEDGEYDGAGLSVIVKNRKGGWNDPKKLEIVNYKTYAAMGDYKSAFLAPSGKTLIYCFSESSNSDKHELYFSHLTVKDKWSKPKSIKDFTKFVGKALNNNTWSEPVKIKSLSLRDYDEYGPFMAADGVTLYYSSNKPGGLGGQDIWMSKRLDDTWQNWSEPVNLGPTINSEGSETYYALDAKGEEAYMIKMNPGYRGDIVKINLIKELRPNPVILITGKVFNAKTKEPIGASIEYENLADGKNVGIAQTDPQTGQYKIVLPYGTNYGFMAYTDKFISVSDNLDLSAVAEYKEITRDLYLVPLEVGSTIRLNNIFFDVAKATLRSESFPELDRLAGLMTQNGKMQIELSGHTDNVGSDETNLKLSADRAKTVTDYLVGLGIAAERIQSKGYGETKPLGTNDTEEGRQLNRRVEFTILKN